MAAAKQDLLCKVVLKQNLPQYPTSTPCPELRLCHPITGLTAVEMAVKQRIHHVLEGEKQRSPSPSPGAAQPQGIAVSWDWPQFYYYSHLQTTPLNPHEGQGGARVTQENAGGMGQSLGTPGCHITRFCGEKIKESVAEVAGGRCWENVTSQMLLKLGKHPRTDVS